MSQEVRLAFEHPAARAEATAPDRPLDRISLRDHIVEVEIGAFQAERGTTQRVCFNVVVEVEPVTAPLEDDVDRILSYDRVTEAIAAALAEERLNLLETLAERIAQRILRQPMAIRCFVRVEKLDRGPGALGVEIVRARDGSAAGAELTEAHPHPALIYLSNAAIASPRLGGWLDVIEAEGRPAVLCVGPPDATLPQAGQALAQRRIDLLGLEQNAWVLAGRDRRCVVVESRTELDWGMRNGQISVWAPSKLVLDAVDGPPGPARDAPALAAWIAGVLEAAEIVYVGEAPPEGLDLPARHVAPDADRL